MRTALLLMTLLAPGLAGCGPKDPAAPVSGFCSPDPAAAQQQQQTGTAAASAAGCELAAAGK
ncbi:MAG TPA: hypothetical protein VGK67_34815 [Myxococcales bacterium]|jgi:hypothetical protein